MEYHILKKLKEVPFWTNLEDIALFVHEEMKPFHDTLPDTLSGIRSALTGHPQPGGFILIAHIQQKIQGALVILNTGMTGYIPENLLLFVAVKKSLRGRGIGSALIQLAKETCRTPIKLHVESDNPAKHLYEKLGFTNKYLEMRFMPNGGSS